MTSALPLEGIRVLELGHIIAGPSAGLLLADLGADVIKVERPGEGDQSRGMPAGTSANFHFLNRNKRSIAIDLKGSAEARALFLRLVAGADVVIDNFAYGAVEALGLGYDVLAKTNPGIIYLALKGFLPGPDEARPFLDELAQMSAGLAFMTGPRGQPLRAGASIVDVGAAACGIIAVLAALQQRTHTGRGQLVDVAMLDASLAFLSSFVTDYTVGGHVQGQSGNRAQSRLPTADVFKVKGGHILLAVNNEKQFGALARAIGLPDLANDPRFRDWPARVANDAALRAIIEAAFASDDDKTWEARLTNGDVPCSRVWSIAEIVAHPQLAHRDVLQRVETRYGPMTLVGSGFRLAHGGGSIEREPALPGEHAQEVLGEAGYGESEIAALRRDGVI